MRASRGICAVAVVISLSFMATSARAQRVVVSHDEWMTGTGYFNANEQQFVSNALSWFGLSGSGNILIYSENAFLTNQTFQDYLTGLGYSVTADGSPTSFAGYDAVLSEGVQELDGAGLAAYATGGGNVFYWGGTGIGGAAAEAAYSNLFLNAVGLGFAPTYNGIGTVTTSGFAAQGPFGAALFSGVSSVYGNNGNSVDITTTSVAGWTTQVFIDEPTGQGVYAAAAMTSTVPEPSTWLMLATGLLALGFMAWRRKTRQV